MDDQTPEKDVVRMSHGYAYLIERRDPKTGTVTFFKGFCNEVVNQGLETESQCWGIEDWCGSEDVAHKFRDYAEAKVVFDNLDDSSGCHIAMFGKGLAPSFFGTTWYPLKDFR